MAFTLNMSTTSSVDNSIILAYDQQFIVAAAQEQIMDQFVSYKKLIGAKSIDFPKYSNLALVVSALDEDDDVTSEALVDAQIILTPAEYGNVVTRTALASFQTGGTVDLAAARLVGINMARSMDKLALLALDASSNALTVDGGAESSLDATDVMTTTFLNKLYNKLARASVQPLSDGQYIAVMHEDCIADLRASTGAGSWQDINKYSNPESVLKNEVGSVCGFKIVRNNHASITDGGGASTVDTYKNYFMGFNALGKAVSSEGQMVLSGPYDKLARFVNIGWKGCFQYKIVDQDAIWVGITASSVGENA